MLPAALTLATARRRGEHRGHGGRRASRARRRLAARRAGRRAVLGSTDAAAMFSTLRHLSLPRRLVTLLEAESGLNDAPVVIAVTLLSSADVHGFASALGAAGLRARRRRRGRRAVRLSSAVAGLRRAALPAVGLYPIATLALALASYAAAASAAARAGSSRSTSPRSRWGTPPAAPARDAGLRRRRGVARADRSVRDAGAARGAVAARRRGAARARDRYGARLGCASVVGDREHAGRGVRVA